MGIGLSNYYDLKKAFRCCAGCTDGSNRNVGWSTFILPFIDEAAAWAGYDQAAAYDSAANSKAAAVVIPIYLCPSTVRFTRVRIGNTSGDVNGNGIADPGDFMAMINYGGIYGYANAKVGANGIMIYDKAISLRQVTDGAS